MAEISKTPEIHEEDGGYRIYSRDGKKRSVILYKSLADALTAEVYEGVRFEPVKQAVES
jgi:hypothetical protein